MAITSLRLMKIVKYCSLYSKRLTGKGGRSKAPVKAGKELGVKVPRIVKDSDQLWPPSHASATRKGSGEALTGVRAGLAIELRNHLIRIADLVIWWGRQNGSMRNRKWRTGSAES